MQPTDILSVGLFIMDDILLLGLQAYLSQLLPRSA